jgi:serine/threonine protein kinase
MTAQKPSEADPLDAVVESFLQRYRRGERPSVAEYAERYPELADRIREAFPALAMIEELGSVGGPSAAAADTAAPAQLGDYRLLREIGRGGMGIVYEAVQESLGRHVALKVLPPTVAQRPLYLERFHREARAAAQLHHTNIVPVYGVGEEDGTCYYTMQFIQGQGLDVVLQDVKRLRGLPPEPSAGAQTGASALGLAQSLLTGEFAPRAAGAATETVPPPASPAVGSQSGLSGEPESRYYRSVARLGTQAAEGLAHAHAQGVLHRDIKPSNLLLDGHGTLWITDFGLAKAEDSDNLTGTGDIVGTVRYMAPERFQGQADARSDIYALGVTLYELLTLRPPFSGINQAELIGQITEQQPKSPRQLAPLLPRDLETIVLKAMAREPAVRYATAAALAEDLHCFLENRPIQARRTSPLERLRRWCRRNPGMAALIAVSTLLLVTIAAVSSVAALWLRDANKATLDQLRLKEMAEKEANRRLYESLFAQAQASRWSARPGRRQAALTALEEAATLARTLQLGDEQIRKLRNEAIATLTLADLDIGRHWDGYPEGTIGIAFDGGYQRYVRINKQGRISVRRLADDQEVRQLQAETPSSADIRVPMRLSPSGRYLYAWYKHRPGPKPLLAWDLTRATSEAVLSLPDVSGYAAFAPQRNRPWPSVFRTEQSGFMNCPGDGNCGAWPRACRRVGSLASRKVDFWRLPARRRPGCKFAIGGPGRCSRRSPTARE